MSIEERLPKALSYHILKRGSHHIVQWRDSYWFTPKENSLYKNGKNILYAETKDPLLYDLNDKLEIYNPKTQEYENVSIPEKNWFCRHGAYDEKNYLQEVVDYISIDYDDSFHIYTLDIGKYILENLHPEISLDVNGWGDACINISGSKKRMDVFKEHIKNQKSIYKNGELIYNTFNFFTYNEVYSFMQEFNVEIKKFTVSGEYSEMYDNIISGKLSKEDFLSKILI